MEDASVEKFKLERYFADREFALPYHLSDSDCEPVRMENLLRRADPDLRARWHNLVLGYTESQGDPTLREAISLSYREIPPENILVGAPEECIYIAMHSLLRRGDHLVVTSPAYQSLYAIAQDHGCEITQWFPEKGDGNWYFDPAFLVHAIRPHTLMLVVNFPHNPTGALPLKNDWETIVRCAREYNLILFSDEMYRGLEYGQKDQLNAACDCYENAISLAGMSKAFGLAGLRIGWLASQSRHLLDLCAGYKDWTTICPPAPSEILALIALQNGEYLLGRNKEIIAENLEHARRFFQEEYRDLFGWFAPEAGSVCFPFFRGETPIAQIAADVEKKQRVLLVPGDMFDYPGNHFRIGLGKKRFPEALNKFREYMGENQI